MHNIAKITGFFTSLNIPFPAANAHFVSGLEDPGKFYVADPYTFLFASLMVLIFGAGLFSVDRLLASRVQDQTTKAR